jgi:hypothetical protein
LKDCPRCGFLNPDRTTHCMKCRFNFEPQPDEPRFEGVGGRPAPEDKPDLLGPPPDLDDTFSGAGPSIGGYNPDDMPQRAPSAVAPGDAYAVMTGKEVFAPGGPEPQGRRGVAPAARRPHADRKLERQLAKQLKQPPAQAAPPRPKREKVSRPKPSMPKVSLPKVDVSKLRDLVSARNVMTLIVGALVLAALIYALAGSRYFEKPEQKVIDASIATMGGLTSYRISSTLVMTADGIPPLPGTDSVLTGRNAFSATYSFSEPGIAAPLAIIKAAGKTYASRAGGPWTGTPDYGNLSFSAADLFTDVSSLRLVGTEQIDGVTCDRFTFTCSGRLLGSLVPGGNVVSKRVPAEAWIEQSSHLLRHAKMRGQMASSEIDSFDCAADVGYSDFGTAPAVSPPVQ